MKKIYIVFGVILLALLVVGCSGSNNTTTESKSDNSQPATAEPATQPTQVKQEVAEEPLTIIDSKLVKEEYIGYSITGTAKANKDMSYAEISAKCYGPDGAVIGSYLTNMQNLKAGETWNFKVIGPMDDSVRVENYTIAAGNCF